MTSLRLREYFRSRYQIDVGLYSYGCFDPGRIGSNTTIGRYCSIASTAHIIRRNHLLHALTMHPYLYNETLGFPVCNKLPYAPICIEDDVWIGHNAVVLPTVSQIGRGAVVGAGAIVTKDVPRYAIVGGNPARVLKSRFDAATVEFVESTRWWEMNRDELAGFCKRFPQLVCSVEARST